MSLEDRVCVNSMSLSARVLFPWSMWAIMQKFRIFFIDAKIRNFLLAQ